MPHDVDMEWTFPPIQHPANAAVFAAARLRGEAAPAAYLAVARRIGGQYLRAVGLIEDGQPWTIRKAWGSEGQSFISFFVMFGLSTDASDNYFTRPVLFKLSYHLSTGFLFKIDAKREDV